MSIFKSTNNSRIKLLGRVKIASGGQQPQTPVSFLSTSFVDTDNDGYSDAVEIAAGTNPNDPNNFPVSLFNVFNNI